MCRAWVIVILVAALSAAQGPQPAHRDYVPDQKTAERIADAVLVGQYGEARVKMLRPLRAESVDKDYWLVQGYEHAEDIPEKGSGVAVWINKHSGCIGKVLDHMK